MASVFQFGYHTETAGTEITEIVPPLAGKIPRITSLSYKVAGTAHTVYVLRCLGTTTASDMALSGQTSLLFTDTSVFKDSSGTAEVLAANDMVAYVTDEGIEANEVATVTGTTVQMAGNISNTVSAGAAIYVFAEETRAVHVPLYGETSTVNDWTGLTIQGGIPGDIDRHNVRSGAGDPLLILSTNPTAAGAIKYVAGEYVDSTEITMN
jgi:hypothetical protein